MAENKIIAIDLGGTNLRTALLKNNKILKYHKQKTPKTKTQLLREMTKAISEIFNKSITAIKISSAGPLDSKKGIIKNPPNLALKNFNLKQFLEKKFKVPVKIENDANCVALAEAKLGCKKLNFIVLTLGTGIGGGIIIKNDIYTGQGMAGELGHIILDNKKDFETLWQESRKLTEKYFKKQLMISELLKLNNQKSNQILEQTADCLGQGIASLINIFDPEIVVLSGGVKETGVEFLNKIKKYTNKYKILRRKTPIKWTNLKHPGILGAGLLK